MAISLVVSLALAIAGMACSSRFALWLAGVARRLDAPVLDLYARNLLIKLVTRYNDCSLNACRGSDPEVVIRHGNTNTFQGRLEMAIFQGHRNGYRFARQGTMNGLSPRFQIGSFLPRRQSLKTIADLAP